MNYPESIGILILALCAIYYLRSGRRGRSDEFTPPKRYPYKKKFLLTKSEYAFFKALRQKCGNQFMICPKVRMEDFLSVTDNENRAKYRGYIKSRHVDFLLCDNELHMLAGIELDDASHNGVEAKKKDKFKDEVFKQIGVPLFRIKETKGNYEPQIDAMLSAFGTEGNNDRAHHQHSGS